MKNKNAFTLVELIVVITILAILGTIAFLSLSWYSRDARNSKIVYDVKNLTKMMEVKLSKGEDLDNLVLNNRMSINWVNSGSTVLSWAYLLSDLDYWVGTFDFKKMRMNWDDFVYNDRWVERPYLFAYVKTPEKLFYEFVAQNMNQSWRYSAVISWDYYRKSSIDTKWLISENWYDVWLKNWEILTWSLY